MWQPGGQCKNMMQKVLTKKQTGVLLATLLSLLFFLVPAVSHASYISDKIGELMFYLANAIGGSVLFLGALLLDTAIYKLVIEMGSMFNDNHRLGQAVTTGWVLIRDLINMTFIFGLIYIGIKTILNSEDSGTRKQLGLLIVAALLINFSLFLTQLMVDFSNLLATQIYSQLVSGNQIPASSGSVAPHTTAQSPISSKFLTTVKMSGLLNKDGLNGNGDQKSVISGGNLMFFSLLLMIFYCLAGFAFLMGAISIVTRFIALLLFMIFSPVVLLGWILPKFASYSAQWWENFWKYLFYAPIYIFMLYLSLQALTGLTQSSTALGSAASAQQLNSLVGRGATVGMGEIVMIFLIMVGFLWASLKIGEKLGIAGAKMAMGGFKTVGLGATGMASGLAYRTFAGRPLDRIRKGYEQLDKVAEDSSRGKMARLGAKTLRGVAGGEAGRRAVIKARDYGAGGAGWTEKEKLNDERSARAARGNRLAKISENVPANIGQADKAQLGELMGDKKARAQIIQNAHLLKPDQIKSLLESDKIDDQTKKELADGREAGIINLAKTSPDKLLSGKASDIADLPDKVFDEDNFVTQLDVAALKALERKQGKREVAQKVRKKMEAAISGNAFTSEADLDRLSTVEDWLISNPAGKSFGK